MGFWAHSLHSKWDDVLQGETSIAVQVFHKLPSTYNDDWKSSWQIIQSLYGPYGIISSKKYSHFLCKIWANAHLLCMGNGTLCCNGRHPLLINCVIPFLTCMAMTKRASDSIYKPLMANTVSLIPKITLKFHEKYRFLGTLSAQQMRWCAARRDIHCCSSVPSASLDI